MAFNFLSLSDGFNMEPAALDGEFYRSAGDVTLFTAGMQSPLICDSRSRAKFVIS